MKKLILLGLLSLFSSSTFALSVDYQDEDFQIYARDNGGVNFKLYSSGSGTGKSESSATKIYMPWAIPAATPITTHYLTTNLGGKNSTAGGIIFDLELVDDSRDDLELFVAVKNGSETEYIVVGELSESTPFISLSKICAQSTDLDCAALDASGFGNNVTDDAYFYVFYADEDENFSQGTTVNPSDSDINNGVFFRIYFSNRLSLYSSTANRVITQKINRGDKSLYVEFEGNVGDAVINRTGIFGGKSSSGATQDTFYEIYSKANESRELLVKGLSNDVEYCFLARYIDQFGFKSLTQEVLASNCETPIEIEQLLKEKSCFLVTAGFQRDHFVLDYFRAFRDDVLLKNFLGSEFVKFYYSLAPAYTKYIYSNSYLAKTIRIFSYGLYYIMKNFISLIMLSLLASGVLIFSRLKNGKKNLNC